MSTLVVGDIEDKIKCNPETLIDRLKQSKENIVMGDDEVTLIDINTQDL